MTITDRTFFAQLAASLHLHPSMSLQHNPVLVRAEEANLPGRQTQQIIGQYCWLVRMIVRYLEMSRMRNNHRPATAAELRRNRAEEKGSRTAGIPHSVMLRDRVNAELGFDPFVDPNAATTQFLNAIRTRIETASPAYVAGMVYALEASATPELFVVAQLLNIYAEATGKLPVADLAAMKNVRSAKVLRSKMVSQYALSDFLVMHTVDFELGHESRLKEAIIRDGILDRPVNRQSFQEGYEFVLNTMDMWWEGLAQ
jgi:hypothetical protein